MYWQIWPWCFKTTDPAKFSLALACWPWSFISPDSTCYTDPRVTYSADRHYSGGSIADNYPSVYKTRSFHLFNKGHLRLPLMNRISKLCGYRLTRHFASVQISFNHITSTLENFLFRQSNSLKGSLKFQLICDISFHVLK